MISARSVLLLWILAFVYSLAIGLILQKLVLPMMPDMHAGHGLMRDDAIYFHETAVTIAERIKAFGWGEWRLVPSGEVTGNVGLLAAVYALLGPNPVFFLPLTSAFHALGAVLIVLIGVRLLPTRAGLSAGLTAGFCFLVFPSALVWFGQNHKDAFAIAGFLLTLLAFIRAIEQRGWRSTLGNAAFFAIGLIIGGNHASSPRSCLYGGFWGRVPLLAGARLAAVLSRYDAGDGVDGISAAGGRSGTDVGSFQQSLCPEWRE